MPGWTWGRSSKSKKICLCTGIGFGFILKVEYGAWGGVPPQVVVVAVGFCLTLVTPPQCSFHSVF